MSKLVGLSLSFCIQDMINGTVSADDVQLIVSGTSADTDEQWKELMEHYSKSYWRKNAFYGTSIASQLRRDGKIHQPRCFGGNPPNIGGGRTHWLKLEPVAV